MNVAAVATGLIGGIYLLAQFTLSKFNDMQERLLRDRVAREKYVRLCVPSYRQLASSIPAKPGGLLFYDHGIASDLVDPNFRGDGRRVN